MRIRDDDALGEPEFSMAPLIDVVFQMLIFFLVATSWASREQSLDVELPEASTAVAKSAPADELVIDVQRDGTVALSGRVLARSELGGALVAAARANPRIPVTIRGDRFVHHEDVVAVMDACGQAGLSNLAIGTLEPR
ncbi:MAG: biopolymer transporter ExbD [Planctomycetes bacterium]|nr:biopolymer transporter ExbD [Planctomycetota bacterium]